MFIVRNVIRGWKMPEIILVDAPLHKAKPFLVPEWKIMTNLWGNAHLNHRLKLKYYSILFTRRGDSDTCSAMPFTYSNSGAMVVLALYATIPSHVKKSDKLFHEVLDVEWDVDKQLTGTDELDFNRQVMTIFANMCNSDGNPFAKKS